MKISAKDIERWAETRDAQGELPRLIRRQAVQAGTVTEIAFPAGDSLSRPGWDRQILSKDGDAWVPGGRSAWEVSVERNPRLRVVVAARLAHWLGRESLVTTHLCVKADLR